jgi:uncharacterized protein (TIGR02217 family)
MFYEFQLDPRLSFGYKGGPMWNTQKVITIGGQRFVNKNWSAPLHRFDFSHSIKTMADFAIVRNLFMVVSGAFDGFRFKDWHDFKVVRSESALTLVSGSDYQLGKNYVAGSRTFTRTITKPVTGSVTIYDAGGSPLVASIDTTTGIATVSGTPDSWAGAFDVPVAFEKDEFDPEIIDHGEDYLIEWGGVVVEEIRL